MFDETQKRNCGHTGPTTPEGRAISSQNSRTHGACSQTLILASESEEEWLRLLRHWTDTYNPEEDSLKYDFVLRTAQAEWHRIRIQRYYDSLLSFVQQFPPHQWMPDETKRHDLALRYKTAAERAFQREYRLLEQHCKLHPTPFAPEFDPNDPPVIRILGFDDEPECPNEGVTSIQDCLDEYETKVPRQLQPSHRPGPQVVPRGDPLPL